MVLTLRLNPSPLDLHILKGSASLTIVLEKKKKNHLESRTAYILPTLEMSGGTRI